VGAYRLRRPAPAPSIRFAFAWPHGNAYRYDVAWTSATRARLLGAGSGANAPDIEGRVDLAAQLVLRSYGMRDGAYVLAARVENVTRHDLVLVGAPVLATDDAVRATFDQREAIVEVDPTGIVRSVAFAHDAPPLFRNLMRAIVELAQPIVAASAASRWTHAERTPVGRGDVEYVVVASDPPSLVRTRKPYSSVATLSGRELGADETMRDAATIRLDPSGHLVALDEDESVSVRAKDGRGDDFTSSTRVAIALREVSRFDAGDPPSTASLSVAQPGEIARSASSDEKLLDQRIAGMTYEELERDLLAKALVGSVADRDWLLRASGLLKKHPERCMDLVALFEDRRMNDRGRAQLLDLLAGTGTPAAQDAMRAALESREATRSPATYAALLQRVSVVARPTDETLAFVAHAREDARDARAKTAATYALGAAAGNAMRAGDRAAGERYGAVLVAALDASTTGDAKRTNLAALGNLGLDAAVPVVARFARDPDAGVRGAAAWALRKTDSPDARSTLLALARDESADVEARAFEAMGKQPLARDDLAALSRIVVAGETQPSTDSALLTLLAEHSDGGEPVDAMLRTLLARNDADKRMQAQIRHALAAMQSAR
jgi:hypothetical protein